jgi:hypothetical protein
MKTTLKIATLILTAAAPCAALAAVAGIAEPAAFNVDLVFPLIAITGLQLIAMADYGRRPEIDLSVAPVVETHGALPRRICGFSRDCAAA